MLILVNRHQAELNGLSGGSSVAMVGGIGASLVGTLFLVAACLHWRLCVRHPVALLSGANPPVALSVGYLGTLKTIALVNDCYAEISHVLIAGRFRLWSSVRSDSLVFNAAQM
jgi:hypothetical protein